MFSRVALPLFSSLLLVAHVGAANTASRHAPIKPAADAPAAASLALDGDFRTPQFHEPRPPARTLLLPDGKYVTFFNPTTLGDQRAGAIVRFLPSGARDTSFSFSREYNFVSAAVPLNDGKLLVSATSVLYREQPTERILRLNADGSIDPTFNSPTVGILATGSVRAFAIQPDGKILVAGFFDTFGGSARTKIARVMPDGTIDESFNPPQISGRAGIWTRPVLQGDGKILISGDFNTVNGTSTLPILRLNADGSRDTSFQAAAFDPQTFPIRGIVVQPTGNIVIAGRFRLTSTTYTPLVRLLSSGTRDTTFTSVLTTALPLAVTSHLSRDLVAQPDGKLVTAFSNSVYRFHPEGAFDASLRQPALFDTTFYSNSRGFAFTLDLLPGGGFLVGGGFTNVDPETEPPGAHFGVVRLTANGALDPAHTTLHHTATELFPTSFARLADGSTFAAFGNAYVKAGVHAPHNVARLLPNGTIDTTFTFTSINPNGVVYSSFLAQDLVHLSDGGLLAFGTMRDASGGFQFGAGKFRPDGSEDLGFRLDPAAYADFRTATPLSSGKVLVSPHNDAQATLFALARRLQRNGKVDRDFQLPASIRSVQVIRDPLTNLPREMNVGSYPLAVQSDGRILFGYLAGDHAFRLVRLHADGSVDGTFASITIPAPDAAVTFPQLYDPLTNVTLQPANGVWNATFPILDAQVMPDGRIILAGRFTSFNGVPARGLVRLNADGSVDASFAAGSGAQWIETTETATFFPHVEAVELQTDGKLLIAGTFEAFNGAPRPGLASLHPDGSVDTSFPVVARRLKHATGRTVLARQPDGSFLLSSAYAFPHENEPVLVRIKTIGGVPVVGGPNEALALLGRQFRFQLSASGQPTSYTATGLPQGFTLDAATGVITGTATLTNVGSHVVTVTATNGEGTSAPYAITITTPPDFDLVSAASRHWHNTPGGAQAFDIDLPLRSSLVSVECRNSSFYRYLVFTFRNDVALGYLQVNSGVALQDNVEMSGNTLTVRLTNVADAQTLTFTLKNATDIYSQVLPDQMLKVSFLPGDTNGDRVVNAGDALQSRSRSGQTANATNFRSDVNMDGVINGGDTVAVRSRSGSSLPAASDDEQ
jgi:uncharacterized delta-60 repeat protein